MRRATLSVGAAVAGLLFLASSALGAAPTLGPVAALEVDSDSALLQGTVNPGGVATAYHFEYVNLAVYSETEFAAAASTPMTSIGAGSEAEEASATAAGLNPDTTYYYRLVAYSTAGTTYGTASTFVTSHGTELACEGDECQSLPPQPSDPTVTTLLQGPGNPRVRYHRLNHIKKRRHARKHRHQRHRHTHRHDSGRRAG